MEFCFTCWEFPFRSSFFSLSCGTRSRSEPSEMLCSSFCLTPRLPCREEHQFTASVAPSEQPSRNYIRLRPRCCNCSYWSRHTQPIATPDECGLASVYSSLSEETASGEDTSANNLTAAHRSLPFQTIVLVENKENGRSAVVRITDRGPFVGERIIDVSQAAAHELGFADLTKVCLKIQSIPEDRPTDEN